MSTTPENPEAPPPPEARPALPSENGPPEKPGPPTERAARRGGGLAILVLALLAGTVGGLLIGMIPLRLPGSPGAEIAALKRDLRGASLPALEARLAELEKLFSDLRPVSADLNEVRQRLTSAERQLEALGAQLTAFAAPVAGDTLPGTGTATLPSGPASSFAQLRERIDILTAEIRAVQSLTARIGALETRIPADLGAQLAALAAKGDLTTLEQRLSKLEANTAAADAKRAAGTIALANLLRTAQSGAPFAAELEAVRFLNADPDLVGTLASYAGQGVRPIVQLAADFDVVETRALRAAGRTWWDRLWAGLFVVKSTQSKSGASPEAILSRARAAVRAGNLQDAVGEVSHLTGPAANAVAAWRAQTEARLTLDSLLTKLSARILADLHG